MEPITPNPEEVLKTPSINSIDWVTQDTAILVIHGIGNQLPLETLDQFGRGLIEAYKVKFENELEIYHQVVNKPDSRKGTWFDNVLRISKKGSEHKIDIYEYYWANYTEDKVTWHDINSWVQGVVSGAKKFYKQNAQLGTQYRGKSPFFSKSGAFRSNRYNFFIWSVSKLIPFLDNFFQLIVWLVARIPFLGGVVNTILKSYGDTILGSLVNVVGDVVVYNVSDPKSKFYDVKKRIQEGAIKALQFLIERSTPTDELHYPSVIVAGHSLGSQVAYDAINRINLLINQGLVNGYDNKGVNNKTKRPISEQLQGFITFGCPLDKILFFLRENVPNDQYIRQQFLDHFNGFKQRSANFNTPTIQAHNGLERYLETMQWRNYYDGRDYV